MTDTRFLRSGLFWVCFLVTLAVTGTFFAWELRLVWLPLPMLPRVPASTFELAYTALLSVLLALAAGLFAWRRRYGSCPVGVKRTFGVAGTLGGLALLCPVCLALPATLIGVGTFFTLLGDYLPLIRLIAVVAAGFAVFLLWPKRVI